MKVTLELNDELKHALELHLAGGCSVQSYVRAALIYFKEIYKIEESGCVIGTSTNSYSADNFRKYNHEMSPKKFLENYCGQKMPDTKEPC